MAEIKGCEGVIALMKQIFVLFLVFVLLFVVMSDVADLRGASGIRKADGRHE